MSSLENGQTPGSVAIAPTSTLTPNLTTGGSPDPSLTSGIVGSSSQTSNSVAPGNAASFNGTVSNSVSSDGSTNATSSSTSSAQPLKTPAPSSSTSQLPQPIPTDTGGTFNSTVAITLNWTTPMLNMGWDDFNFGIDPVTGYRIRRSVSSGGFSFGFVGVGYSLNGTMKAIGNNEGGSGQRLYTIYVPDSDAYLRLSAVSPGDPNLGAMSGLNVSNYAVRVGLSNALDIEFRDLTFEIPVKTQAANFEAMRSQAFTLPVVTEGKKTLYADVRSMQSDTATELQLMYNTTGSQPPQFNTLIFPPYNVTDDRLLLLNNSELVYNIPKNTTLVEVLGPVDNATGVDGIASVLDDNCYAHLNPRPTWWLPGNFPTCSTYGPVNATNQTMFLLPIDPQTSFTLRVGSLGRDAACPISAIRTYPFHYNYATKAADTTNGNPGANDPAQTNKNQTNTTPVILGVVLGVGGGLVLLGFLMWLLHRRKSRSAGEQIVQEQRQRGYRVVQEEDGESFVEYLPPQYRDDWQGVAEPHSRLSAESVEHPGPNAPGTQLPQPQGALGANSTLQEKARALNRDRPRLKQQYAKAFGRPLPSTPRAEPTTMYGEKNRHATSTDRQHSPPGDLRAEYKSVFGLRDRPPGRNSVASSLGPLPNLDSPKRPVSSGSANQLRISQLDYDLKEAYEKLIDEVGQS